MQKKWKWMIYKPISAPLLPSAGYIGNLIDVFLFLFTTKYILVIPLKIKF